MAEYQDIRSINEVDRFYHPAQFTKDNWFVEATLADGSHMFILYDEALAAFSNNELEALITDQRDSFPTGKIRLKR